jgi:CheY-like chemotaxis protein
MSIMASDNRRILIIDDNVEILEDFGKVLVPAKASSALDQARASLFGEVMKETHDESFSVDFAERGEAGLGMVELAVGSGKPYALAFVDMRMPPGWDGVETVTRL